MWYSTMLMITSAVMVVGAALSLAITDGNIPLIAFVIPALFFARGGIAVWILAVGLVGFGVVTPDQPISISLSLWMILPALVLITGVKRNWQVSVLVISVIIAMECGLLALQSDQKLGGAMSYTLMQILYVVMVWISVYFWKPVKVSWWPAVLILALLAGGWEHGALLAFCGSVLALALQELYRIGGEERGDKLSVILPAIAFATIVVIPDFSVPNPVFVAWLLSLTIAWLGDYLINTENEEE